MGFAAFDKADLLYLRDEEEKMRFKEDELRDSERSEFLKLKAKADLDPGKPVPVPRPVKRDKALPVWVNNLGRMCLSFFLFAEVTWQLLCLQVASHRDGMDFLVSPVRMLTPI